MRLSVIIPTHNRPARVLETLEALEAQMLAREAFEVIVVDDGSEEENRQIIRDVKLAHPFVYLEKEQGGLASARNLGAGKACGDILYFLDDDVYPAAATLAEHLASHDRNHHPVAVVGSLPFPDSFKRTPFLWYLERSGHYDLYEIPDKYPGGEPPMPPLNGNSSIPREVFFNVGAYDERFRQYGGEDLDLGYRLAQAGVVFVYNPAAVGHHNHEKDFSQFCVDMERAG
jgi:GT2 family glycosyltransferase